MHEFLQLGGPFDFEEDFIIIVGDFDVQVLGRYWGVSLVCHGWMFWQLDKREGIISFCNERHAFEDKKSKISPTDTHIKVVEEISGLQISGDDSVRIKKSRYESDC
jgi:hypothetical protein